MFRPKNQLDQDSIVRLIYYHFYFNFEYDSGALEAAKFYSVLGGLLFIWLNVFMQSSTLSQTRSNY